VFRLLGAAEGLAEQEVGRVELRAGEQKLDGVIEVAAGRHLVGTVEALGGNPTSLGGDGWQLVGSHGAGGPVGGVRRSGPWGGSGRDFVVPQTGPAAHPFRRNPSAVYKDDTFPAEVPFVSDHPTLVRVVDASAPDPDVLRAAGETIRAGGLVAFPTE